MNFIKLIANLLAENANLKLQLAKAIKEQQRLESIAEEMTAYGCTGLIEQ
jgi:cell shape-determining protein MreC